MVSVSNMRSGTPMQMALTSRRMRCCSKNEAFLNELGNAFDTDFKVDGNVLVGAIKSKGDSISESVAQHVTYGSVSDDNSIALSDLRTLYEGAGYVCVVE